MPTVSEVMGTPAQIARRLAFATAVGLFMGLIGPFGSYDVKPLPRVAAWLVSFWAGSLMLGASLSLAERWSARSGLPRWFARTAGVAATAVPLAAVSAASFRWIGHVSSSHMEWLTWYAQVLAISLPVALGYLSISAFMPLGGVAGAAGAAPSPTTSPARREPADGLLDRLPARLGKDVTALQMEDHYVRIHTPLGSDLVLTSMAQAMEPLGGVDGMRVHRSWWVARAAVEGAAWEGRNLRLRLKGGLEAPVARASIAEVRAAGWLQGG